MDIQVENTVKVEKSKLSKKHYRLAKRSLDIVGGVIGLIPFGIAYGVLFIPYKVGSNKGPMIFNQKRIGENGELFSIYKFRSMRVNADQILQADGELHQKYIANGYKLEPNEDPRITKLGRFIRKTSIDELPQFINVIKGNMSLVGPRPIVTEELEEYKKAGKVSEFLSMKPGITGVWQTAGRSNVGYPDRVFLEISYAKKNSIRFDLKVIGKTIVKVFKKEGAY
ncbi:sugar transferase [Enterococcus faecium]|uniref:sugar transferase n=1 Tax=Enterococcus faecium TaxID=1352 RepID=UPI0010BF88C2|nr:sugar transferase [Enterococcus faecium]MBW4152361.1 sugar transferase [Enterococcus faecium]TKN51317.1 sugar transferase [Enterococcus faecium]TKN99172.1 sugar transferase [Enterococcus faecium]TKQ41541.1 sugar transferase [Enterococcus faecium]TKQ55477.1 sugar transferase [Enterococcus faecium]